MPPQDDLPGKVIAAAIEVHRALGPGLLETAYENCLSHELALRGLPHERQKPIHITYKGELIDPAYRLDLLVDNSLVLEIKSVPKLAPIHKAQLLTYLRLGNYHLGLLLNFNERRLIDGLHRLIL